MNGLNLLDHTSVIKDPIQKWKVEQCRRTCTCRKRSLVNRSKLHGKLDVAIREDVCRIRRGDGAENFSKIRHIATK